MTRRDLLTFGLTAAALAGCGFRPIYMPTESGQRGVAERELAAVEVAIIGDRPGQVLRQALQKRFASDAGPPHRYVLTVDYRIAGEGTGIQTDNSVTGIRLSATLNWTLKSRDSIGKVLTSGSAKALDGLNIFAEQYFASTMETEAVQRRMAENMADQIALQLSVWFNKRAENGPG